MKIRALPFRKGDAEPGETIITDGSGREVSFDELLHAAQAFDLRRSPTSDFEIITPEELMRRLPAISRGWINEKRRPRCAHPLPAVTSRPLQFNWYDIVEWLRKEAARDAERLRHKRILPTRHNSRKSHPTRKSAK